MGPTLHALNPCISIVVLIRSDHPEANHHSQSCRPNSRSNFVVLCNHQGSWRFFVLAYHPKSKPVFVSPTWNGLNALHCTSTPSYYWLRYFKTSHHTDLPKLNSCASPSFARRWLSPSSSACFVSSSRWAPLKTLGAKMDHLATTAAILERKVFLSLSVHHPRSKHWRTCQNISANCDPRWPWLPSPSGSKHHMMQNRLSLALLELDWTWTGHSPPCPMKNWIVQAQTSASTSELEESSVHDRKCLLSSSPSYLLCLHHTSTIFNLHHELPDDLPHDSPHVCCCLCTNVWWSSNVSRSYAAWYRIRPVSSNDLNSGRRSLSWLQQQHRLAYRVMEKQENPGA